MTMEIKGKSLHEWTNGAAGEFARAVRDSIDPNWGKETNGLISYKVKVIGNLTKREAMNYDIEAFSEKEAGEMACKKFIDSAYEDWDDVYADKIQVAP